MQRVSAKPRFTSVCITILLAACWSGTLLAQSTVEENIRPVANVCLAGQSCVGAVRGGSSAAATAAAPVVAAPVAAVVTEVVEAEPAVAAFDAAAAYQMSCFACHASGAAGAPKVGDHEAWTARMEKGMDAVMANVTNGLNAMPPKGMCMTCSGDDLRALVEYMVNQ